MKKTLIYSLILASFILPFGGQIARAQTFSAEQQTSLDTLKQQLIDLLTQEIAVLTNQINTLLAQQAQTTQALADVQTQVRTAVQNTTPVLGAVITPTTVAVGTPQCSKTWDAVNETTDLREKVRIPLVVTGSWKTITATYDDYRVGGNGKVFLVLWDGTSGKVREATTLLADNWDPSHNLSNDPSHPYFEVNGYPQTYNFTFSVDGGDPIAQSATVVACQ